MEQLSQSGYVVKQEDNVATALGYLKRGRITLAGKGAADGSIEVSEDIAFGHKFAVRDIPAGSPVVKYGAVIGTATQDIRRGMHVHLHNMKSNFDMRAATLDVVTADSTDMEYKIY